MPLNLRKCGYPLPGRSTLVQHASKVGLQPGFLPPVMSVLKTVLHQPFGQYCCISFDEAKVKETPFVHAPKQ